MTELAERSAFITGGHNGIGLGIARSFYGRGVKLALADIDAEAPGSAWLELGVVSDAVVAVLDIRDRGKFTRVAGKVEAAVGYVSILVNNAGVAGGAPAHRLTFELWDWGMGINLDGAINGIQTFLPRLIKRDAGGHVVNTASGAGFVAGPSGVIYHPAKFSVVGLSETLAPELRPKGTGVTVLCPGPVATGIIARTRRMQPTIHKPLSPGQNSKVIGRSEVWSSVLADGTSPDAVGAMVLEAVRDNKSHVYTCTGSAEGIAARGKRLLDPMPT